MLYANKQADEWFRSIIDKPETFPFAFSFDGIEYHGFPEESFTLTGQESCEGDGVLHIERNYRLCGLLDAHLICEHDFHYGASEFTVRFENHSDRESPVIENARAIFRFVGAHPMLKGILGDHANWYRPYSLNVEEQPRYFESNSGRATHVYFPYFNLEYGDGGTMLAIGWAGTWRSDFRYCENETECVLKSVNALHTTLKPGESIRTARFVRAPYTIRNEDYATNYWRSYFINRILPKADADGRNLEPFSTAFFANDTGLPNSDGSISERHTTWKRSFDAMLAQNVKTDFRWFDAGWYIAPDFSSPETDWWGTVGTWQLDPAKWPGRTFAESTDYARAHGMKTLMWFEPERVTHVSDLVRNFGYRREWAIEREGVKAISNNIGDPDCYRWTVDRIISTLRENRVEMYREDNNSDPAGLWNYLDELEGENRRGITECKFIDAHYRMGDEIIAATKSYGGCAFVDSCASGGGRNDIESLRRAVPLLRSDYDRTSTGMRLSMTSAFNRFVPFCGANNKEKLGQLDPKGTLDMYVWRASYLPILNVDSQYAEDPGQDWDMLRRGLYEWKQVAPYLLRDMYVHTPWHSAEETDGFTAYSFFDPEKREGVLLAFRQENCEADELTLTLPYAEAGAVLTDADTNCSFTVSGSEMKTSGIKLSFEHKREVRLFWIKTDL